MIYVFIFVSLIFYSQCTADSGLEKSNVVNSRRNALIHAYNEHNKDINIYKQALEDPDPVIRRTAIRFILQQRKPAFDVIANSAVNNSDFIVRKAALLYLFQNDREKSLPFIVKSLQDKNVYVRKLAISLLASIKPRTKDIEDLLRPLYSDTSEEIRNFSRDTFWPFYKHNPTPIGAQNKKIISRIPLPVIKWHFNLDRNRDGHEKGWYKPSFDDSKWKTLGIGAYWQFFGQDYTGVAWYRNWFILPEKPKDAQDVEIFFKGVDESAWVWVNGQYAGQHHIGVLGRKHPFRLNITDMVKWKAKNQITIRVLSTTGPGGIRKMIDLEILGGDKK